MSFQKKPLRIACVYQVLMHYRLPFYERLSLDDRFEFKVFHGNGLKNSKLQNANTNGYSISAELITDYRIPLKIGHGKNYIPFSPLLLFKLLVYRPDIILTEGSSSLLNASIVFIYSKLCNKKFIWWSLGMLEGRRYSGIRGLIGRWEKVIEQNSDAIFTYSSAGKRYFISRGVNSEKIFRGINVLDTQRKLAEIKNFVSVSDHNIDSSKFNVAFIGTITKEKNLTMLLQAVRLFSAHFKDTIVLHVIGDGDYMPLLKQNIMSLNLEQQVVLHGRINSGASTILSQCKVMVLPGLGGLAICEAMLNRMAVITGIADGTEKDLVSENNGFIIKNIDDKKIAEKLLIFYQDNALLERFRNESFNLITGKFHFDNYYQNFSDAVEYVSNSK